MFKKQLILALISSGLMLSAQTAKAACCGDGAVAAMATTTVGGVTNAMLTAINLQLVNINKAVNGIISAQEGSMKVAAVVNADLLDNHKNLLIMALAAGEKSRIANEQSLKTLPMAAQSGASAQYAGQGIIGAGKVTSYANIALAKRHLTNKSSTGLVLDAYQRSVKLYGENRDMPNADILADSLLSGATKSGNQETLTFTKSQLAAAQDYIANAVDVSPPPDISDSAANTVEGRRYRMLLRAEKARMSLPFKAYADALAYRTPIPGFTAQMVGVPNVTGDISYQEFLTNEVRRRYNNPDWYRDVGGATPTNLQREALLMHALDLHLRMEESKHLEKIELLLAQMNMNQISGGPMRQQIDLQRNRVAAK